MQCFKHPNCNSSNTKNKCIAKHAYVFASRVKLSISSSVKKNHKFQYNIGFNIKSKHHKLLIVYNMLV